MAWIQSLIAAFIPMQSGTRGTAVCFTGMLLMFATAWWAPGIEQHPELRAQILGPTGSVTVLAAAAVARRILSKSNGAASPADQAP